jgi:hypothetical protein
MGRLSEFWKDDSGAILTAEAVMVGTVGVLGSVVGLNMAANAVDAELKEVASAIRSLDQSYGFVGRAGCGGWTAGSYYHQQPVSQALAELCGSVPADPQSIKDQVDAHRKATDGGVAPGTDASPTLTPAITPAPENDLPKKDEAPKKKKPKKDKDNEQDDDDEQDAA